MGVEVLERVVEVDVEVVPMAAVLDVQPPGDRGSEYDSLVWVLSVVGVGGSEQDLGVAAELRPLQDLGGDRH